MPGRPVLPTSRAGQYTSVQLLEGRMQPHHRSLLIAQLPLELVVLNGQNVHHPGDFLSSPRVWRSAAGVLICRISSDELAPRTFAKASPCVRRTDAELAQGTRDAPAITIA